MLYNSELKNKKTSFRKTVEWWHGFWRRSHIAISPEKPDPADPVWQNDWYVSFKLHAPENTTIECDLKNGAVTKLKVHPESRSGDVRISYTE